MSIINNGTLLAKVDENGVITQYPLRMADVRSANQTWSFPTDTEEETINDLGYMVVESVAQPAGDVVVEGAPEFVGGVWKQSWDVRSFNEEEAAVRLENLKSSTITEVDLLLTEALKQGFKFNFGTDEEPDEAHVQLRAQDRANITGCGLKADRLFAKGVTDPVMPFRTFENTNKLCTPAQMKDLSDQAYDAYLVFMQLAWTLKDATTNAVSSSEVPAVPDALELPSGWQRLVEG